MNYYERSKELFGETVQNRRWLHQNAEVGLEMPKAQAFVMEKLKEAGLDAKPCGHGVTAEIGPRGGKTILLRADMDALPMREESGEPFACPTGTEAHACGHDLHAAMLLTAAKMLKEQEESLKGRVRFMFQPAEETFEGAKDMIEQGILEGVDAAMGCHVGPGKIPAGMFMYNAGGTMMHSVDGFRIKVKGKGAHGGYPQLSIDPINIGAHIHLALQELIAREADPGKSSALTIGSFNAGAAPNIIPDIAVLQGTMRNNDMETRNRLLARIKEICELTAKMFGGSVEIETLSEVPPLICDKEFTEKVAGYIMELPIPGLTPYPGMAASASEDFAVVAAKVPSAFIYLSAGFADERGDAPAHNPKVVFNEDVLNIGPAVFAHSATRWLAEKA